MAGKYRGQIRATNELLTSILGLPDGVEVFGIEEDRKRELTNILIRSEEEVPGVTFLTGESQEFQTMDSSESTYLIIKKAIELVMTLENAPDDNHHFKALYNRALTEIEAESMGE